MRNDNISIACTKRHYDNLLTVEAYLGDEWHMWDFDYTYLPELRVAMADSKMPMQVRAHVLRVLTRRAEGVEV